jgi:hypothetical protein
MSTRAAEAGLAVMQAVAARRHANEAVTDAVMDLRATGGSWSAVAFAVGARSRQTAVATYGARDLLRLAAAAET